MDEIKSCVEEESYGGVDVFELFSRKRGNVFYIIGSINRRHTKER